MGQEKSKAAQATSTTAEDDSSSATDGESNLGDEYDIEDQNTLATAFTPSEGSKKATERLIKDLKEVTKKNFKKEGIIVKPVNDNLYKWHVKFKEFPEGTTIARDMQFLNEQTGKDHLLLEIIFSKKYPESPPFMRVVYPRLLQYTGHVTIGGSICVETLTKSGWSSKFCLPTFLIMIKQLLVEGGASLDHGRVNSFYTEQEAKSAFLRVAKQHHWRV
eukprot:TRINITY_DN436_c0_g1_i1.p1 TRINITY_DN436_c0_g1~~TRINITY_DN436_c0_g1_i1.p1  ORF type:complete len:218 (-),score=52.92 TRINITY_DN436_c0_g1_i1:111-764(-)